MNQPPRVLEATSRPVHPRKPKWRSRGWWLKQLHNWHYMSAALSLAGLLMFAATGLTLNHAASIPATPTTIAREGALPPPLAAMLRATPGTSDAGLPAPVAAAAARITGLDPAGRPAEWTDADVTVAMPRPGGDAWVSIDRASGRVTSERTSRGLVSYLNDLHKGRNAGPAWGWLIDVFAIACLVFAVTGLALLQMLGRNRPATWPLVAAGVLVPVAIAVFLIH